ncbi:insulinoma-associated protein 2 [Eublepharis macularius]|uniref:Insulinoma-associated protein 2 n=1 Tax=Eublepharis macularius TaxID=481883 RepID=A0AA97IV35_EUBMA|nr:insulinoma-associated protein 2 [Eublepharis macularius]
MPRGFLVKRSRRPGGSYRLRPPAGPPAALPEEAPRGPAPLPEPPPPPRPQEPHSPLAALWEGGGSDRAAAPDAEEPEAGPLSPAPAESFPPSPAPAAEERLPRTPLPLPLPLPAAPLCLPGALKRPPRAKAPPAKKPKAARRLSFADEVTTSPVLGLRIKAAPEAGSEGPRAARPTLLGEFVCQLCKEPYGDPLALAQHRCSRIVRVEYRCPECHKIFSCPANLASHRRWHKPRPPAPDKENSRRDQHLGARDSACCRDPPAARPSQLCAPGEGGPADAPPGELFLCPYCHKTFRRQAYLRKHLGTHQPPGPAGFQPRQPSPQPATFPCHLCGAHFPSADLRDKHRLWHAVREELLLPLAQPEGSAAHGEQQIFSCKHCPATFFSSPGLTRHINKCHPSENRQVLLLQMPVRPGC